MLTDGCLLSDCADLDMDEVAAYVRKTAEAEAAAAEAAAVASQAQVATDGSVR